MSSNVTQLSKIIGWNTSHSGTNQDDKEQNIMMLDYGAFYKSDITTKHLIFSFHITIGNLTFFVCTLQLDAYLNCKQ